jgi:hypothetical protein
MAPTRAGRSTLFACGLLTIAAVIAVWTVRFLPLYDLPAWLYEVKVLRNYQGATENYPLFFALRFIPVPNLGLIAPVWLLSHVVSLEAAGKIFLTIITAGLPWAFRYAVISVAGRETPLAYVGFPLVFNLFFYIGQASLLGFVFFLVTIGYFVPRLATLSGRGWWFLTAVVTISYFIHAVTWFLTILTLGSLFLTAGRDRPWRRLALAVLPSVALFLGYLILHVPEQESAPAWGVLSLLRNLLKPYWIVSKGYGVDSPFSTSAINAAWSLSLVFLAAAIVRARKRGTFSGRGWVAPLVVALLLMGALPGHFSGVYQPGSRFALPALFFGAVICSAIPLNAGWTRWFLLAAGISIGYHVVFFQRAGQQLESLYRDIGETVPLEKPFFTIPVGMNEEFTLRDGASSTVNGMSAMPFYALLSHEGVSWVYGTGLLHMRPEARGYKPLLTGGTPAEIAAAVIQNMGRFKFFETIIVVGRNSASESIGRALLDHGFGCQREGPLWQIYRQTEAKGFRMP